MTAGSSWFRVLYIRAAFTYTKHVFPRRKPPSFINPFQQNAVLEGHGNLVDAVAFSHDSARLASASWNKTVKIWDASSGDCLQTLEIGKALAKISFDGTSSYLRTEIGTIDINASSALNTTPSVIDPQNPRYRGRALSPDGA
ncbi:uncharacterized protein K441DRAFT_558120 [Cenococcum geophilum 1.58]|uniref:uncharacterized protein n=1 Tax=Cenococcum geophilum 1.58 TaxID=794803 RepID=UPI00358E0621|nr:hypothetical protein K441DRAFT_558120 [Cenococcum geophilum 1.58]